MKHFLSAIIVLCFSGMLFSQQFYLKVQGGYGIGISPRPYETYREIFGGEETRYSSENTEFSFGEGFNISTSIGYSINSNFGCELEIQYSRSAEMKTDNYSESQNYNQHSINTRVSNSFYLNPSLILSVEFGSFQPYMKIGPSMAIPGITRKTKTIFNAWDSMTSREEEYSYNGGVALGINSAAGISWKAAKNIKLFFELNNKNISYSPTKGKLEKSAVNGVSDLGSISRSEKEFQYVSKTSGSDNNDPNKPAKVLKTEYPFSSLSFSLGIALTL